MNTPFDCMITPFQPVNEEIEGYKIEFSGNVTHLINAIKGRFMGRNVRARNRILHFFRLFSPS